MKGRHLLLVLIPLLLTLLVVVGERGHERWRASIQLKEVEQLVARLEQEGHLRRQSSQRGVRRAFGEGVKRLRRAEELDPTEVGIPIARGGLYRYLDQPQSALAAFERARQIEPRAEVFAQIAHVQWELGERRLARRAALSATTLDRNLRKEVRRYLGPKKKKKGSREGSQDESIEEDSRGASNEEPNPANGGEEDDE